MSGNRPEGWLSADDNEEEQAVLQRKTEQIGFAPDQTDGGAGDGDGLGEIILPVTPPVVLAVTSRMSDTPSCCAVVA